MAWVLSAVSRGARTKAQEKHECAVLGDSPWSWTITGLEFCVGSTAPLPKTCSQVRLLQSQLGIVSTIVTQVRVPLKSWKHVMMKRQSDDDEKYAI